MLRTRMFRSLVLCAAGALAACNAESSEPGNAALGIAEFQATESATELRILGLDAQRKPVAQLTLEKGTFTMDLDDGRAVDGRQLDVTVQGKRVRHQSEGSRALTLPLGRSASTEVGAFLLDPHVAAPLARWGLRFELTSHAEPTAATAPTGETPYLLYCDVGVNVDYEGGSPCSRTCTQPPNASCGSTGCVQWPDGSVNRQFLCCNTGHVFIDRSCTFPYDPANPCGVAGGAGCAVCLSADYSGNNCVVQGGTTCHGSYCTL